MTKTYWIDDTKTSKSNCIRHLRASVCRDIDDHLEEFVNEDYEAAIICGHIFLPSDLLEVDSDFRNKIFTEYVDRFFKQSLEDLENGKLVKSDDTYFEMREEE